MTLSKRQKNIVNPFARASFEARGVADYELGNSRNKFVIDGIHDTFVNYGRFPEVGQILREVGPLLDTDDRDRSINLTDALVYVSLYPQNGTVINGQIEQLSEDDSLAAIRTIVTRIREQYPNSISGWLTTTSAESLEPENQLFDNTPQGNEAQARMDASRLIGIRRNISPNIVNLLREAFNFGELPLFESPPITQGTRTSPLTDTEQSADLYDWRDNVLPGMNDEIIYYNSFDEKYYYARRTDSTNPAEYDILSIQNGNSRVNKEQLISDGINKILLFAGRGNPISVGSVMEKVLLNDNSDSPENPFTRDARRLTWKQVLSTYLDPRPSSRWVYAVQIPQTWVEELPVGDRTRNISDIEIDPLIVAEKLLTSDNATVSRKVSFTADQFQRYISNLEYTLRQYSRTMRSQGISLNSVTDLPISDLSVEAEKVSQFPANFENFLDVNGIEANEEDIYELFLDDKNDLLYVAVNGIIYTRGVGSLSFLDLTPEQTVSPLLDINAFLDTSPVTFGYVFNSPLIYSKTSNTPQPNWPTWLEFLVEYTTPKIEIFPNEVDVEVKKAKEEYLWGFGAKKGDEPKLFEFLGEITKGSSATELAAIQRLWAKRNSHYGATVLQIGANLASANCNTLQARLMRESLAVLKIWNSKTRVRGLIRYSLFMIRDELIKELVNRRMLEAGAGQTIRNSISTGAQVSDYFTGGDPRNPGSDALIEVEYGVDDGSLGVGLNPARRDKILKDVERFVNREVFCALDIVGDVVEQQILDPIGTPPGVKQLQQRALNPPLTFKIKSRKSTSLLTGQNDAYRKALEAAFEKFLSTLIVGVMKDLVDAALGCGPEIGLGKKSQEDATDGLLNAIKDFDYGSISLNSLTETLPLTFIAQQSGLSNKEVTFVDGTRVVTSTIPKLNQIEQLHADVSEIVTSSEMSSLLKGDADLVLLETIKEMINEGDVDKVGLSAEQLEDPIILLQRQESLRKDDTRYAVLGLTTTDIIAEYFFNLGKAMLDSDLFGASIGQIDDPIEAYCKSKRDLSFDTAQFNTNLSDQQLLEQYTNLVNSKRLQITTLCDLLRANLDFQRQIDAFVRDFGIGDFYNTLLGLLSALSNALFSIFPSAAPELPSPTATEFPYYPLGQDLYFQMRNSLDNRPMATCVYFEGGGDDGLRINSVMIENGLQDSVKLSEELEEGEAASLVNPVYFGGLSYYQLSGNEGRFGAEDDNTALAVNSRTLNNRLLTFNDAGTRTEYLVISVTNDREVNYVLTFGPDGLTNRLNPSSSENVIKSIIGTYFTDRAKPFGLGHVPEIVVQIKGNTVNCFEYIGESEKLPNIKQPSQLNFLSSTELIPRPNNIPMPIIDGPLATLAGKITEDGEAAIALDTLNGFEKLPSRKTVGMISMVESFMSSAIAELLPGSGLVGMNNRDMGALSNGNETLGLTVENFYLTPRAKERLGPAQVAFGTNPFKPMNDVCITMEDRLIADACITSIQQRIRRFLFNTGPLLRVYNYYLTPTTLEIVSDYLTNMIYDDLKIKRLLGPINQSIPFVEKVYGGESSNGFRIQSWMGEREKIKTIVKKIYESILKKLMPTEAYKQVSVFSDINIQAGSPPMSLNGVEKYRRIGGAFWLNFKNNFQNNAMRAILSRIMSNTSGEELTTEQIDAYIDYIDSTVLDENNLLTDQGILDTLAYLPVQVVFALTAIYYDNSVNLVSRHPQMELELNTTRAAADDQLLSVITQTNVTKFILNYRNYPVTIGDETYWSKFQAEKGLRLINKTLNQTVDPPPFFVFFNTIADQDRSLEDFPYDSRVGNAIRTIQPGFITENDEGRILTSFNEDGAISTDNLSTSPWNTLEKTNSAVWIFTFLNRVDPNRTEFSNFINGDNRETGDGFYGTLYYNLNKSRTALVDGGRAYGGNEQSRPEGVPEIATDYLDLAQNLDWLIEANDRAGVMFAKGTGLSHAIWTYIRASLVPYGYPLVEDVPNYPELVKNKEKLEKLIFNNEVEFSGDWDF